MPPLKYGNQPTVVEGVRFASKREAQRWSELRLMERVGAIRDLTRQRRWPLEVNGVKIADYLSDFEYRLPDGSLVVEDTKGVRTPVYRLKKKLMAAVHGIEIREV